MPLKRIYVDPEVTAQIEAKRQAYYARLEMGEEKLPVHDFSRPVRHETPTPSKLARMAEGIAEKPPVEFNPEGGMVIPAGVDVEDVAEARTHTAPGQVSRGALVEEDAAQEEEDEVEEEKPAPAIRDRRDEVEIDDDWQKLDWQIIRKLAAHFTSAHITSRDVAIKVIDAEIERRNSE